MAFLVLVAFLIVPVAAHDSRFGPPWRRLSSTPIPPKTKDK